MYVCMYGIAVLRSLPNHVTYHKNQMTDNAFTLSYMCLMHLPEGTCKSEKNDMLRYILFYSCQCISRSPSKKWQAQR